MNARLTIALRLAGIFCLAFAVLDLMMGRSGFESAVLGTLALIYAELGEQQ